MTLLFAASASVALADNAPSGTHLSSGTPGCTVSGDSTTVSCAPFVLGGVGNTNAKASLVATWSATIDCRNHGGSVVESHTTTFSANPTVTASSTKNGQLSVGGLTASAGSVGQVCPNSNWTPEIRPGTLTLSSFSYTLTFAGFNSPYISITGP